MSALNFITTLEQNQTVNTSPNDETKEVCFCCKSVGTILTERNGEEYKKFCMVCGSSVETQYEKVNKDDIISVLTETKRECIACACIKVSDSELQVFGIEDGYELSDMVEHIQRLLRKQDKKNIVQVATITREDLFKHDVWVTHNYLNNTDTFIKPQQ